jgi:ABC-2 type transport system ATP-binding protein
MLEDVQAGAGEEFSREAFRQSCAGKSLQQSQRYGILSKGQKRWVLGALALAMQPRMVVFDEPADGLDTAARRGLYDELRSFVTRTQAGAVVATHIISDIERIADHVVILRQGKVLLEAPLEDLRECVREIQRPQGEEPVGATEEIGVRMLARKVAGNSEVRWVWCESAEALAALGQGWPSISTVALEDLYLAVTEHAIAVEAHA